MRTLLWHNAYIYRSLWKHLSAVHAKPTWSSDDVAASLWHKAQSSHGVERVDRLHTLAWRQKETTPLIEKTQTSSHTGITDDKANTDTAPRLRLNVYKYICISVRVLRHTSAQGPDLHVAVCRATQKKALLVGQRQGPGWREGRRRQ